VYLWRESHCRRLKGRWQEWRGQGRARPSRGHLCIGTDFCFCSSFLATPSPTSRSAKNRLRQACIIMHGYAYPPLSWERREGLRLPDPFPARPPTFARSASEGNVHCEPEKSALTGGAERITLACASGWCPPARRVLIHVYRFPSRADLRRRDSAQIVAALPLAPPRHDVNLIHKRQK